MSKPTIMLNYATCYSVALHQNNIEINTHVTRNEITLLAYACELANKLTNQWLDTVIFNQVNQPPQTCSTSLNQ